MLEINRAVKEDISLKEVKIIPELKEYVAKDAKESKAFWDDLFIANEPTKEISIEDAITSWFNTVYLPVIHTIDKYKIMKYFKHRTKSDLYVWIIKYFDELKRKFGDNCSLEDAVFDITNEYKISLPTKIKNAFKKYLLKKNR